MVLEIFVCTTSLNYCNSENEQDCNGFLSSELTCQPPYLESSAYVERIFPLSLILLWHEVYTKLKIKSKTKLYF